MSLTVSLWYLLLTGLGLAAFPLAWTLLPGLSDRGYAFSRILGLLIWGYVYWIFGYLGLLRNSLSGIVFAFAVLAGLSVLAWRRIDRQAWKTWWAERKWTVIAVEALFLAAFLAWVVVRGRNPEIVGTEKPMELAFLNAILRSPAFPPNDPWLSGYAISYYYFGYILVGMLSMATGTSAGVAFNLGIAAVFALGMIGAYGVVYNLIDRSETRKGGFLLALLGPFYVFLVSNWEGFLEVLHARGLFWTRTETGELVSGFWRWLDLKDLVKPPVEPFAWQPQRYYWWWRASRVINDVGFTGGQQEVIDEFPFFSFLLGDLHPHVLAIPFVLLAVALSWNFLVSEPERRIKIFRIDLGLSGIGLLTAGLVMGSLAFLNTWDFPIYVALFTGAFAIKTAVEAGWSASGLIRAAAAGLVIGLLGILLYFPFYIGFSSQAGGILPNVLNPTRGAHLWIMFGPLFVPIVMYFGSRIVRGEFVSLSGLRWGFGAVFGLFLISVLIAGAVALLPEARDEALRRLGAPNLQALAAESFSRRLSASGGWLTMAFLLSLAAGYLIRPGRRLENVFAALLVVLALLLVAGPEFVYLRDGFGTRMNTIFKFYYQAWILLALAAAFGTARIVLTWQGFALVIGGAVLGIALFAGLTYPVQSLIEKTEGYNPEAGLVLDGTLHGSYLSDDDRAAVAWLQEADLGVLVEAVGDQYSSAARISAHSGQPAVLGWPGHEGQWRGGYTEVGSRRGDVETIYTSGNWTETVELLNRYRVTYIYVGNLERSLYNLNEAKFERNLPVLFRAGSVTIYGFSPND